MTFISFIGIIATIILIIYVSVRELNIIIAAPLATLIVLITNQMPTSLSSTVGPSGAIAPAVQTTSAVAFGSLLVNAPGFQVIVNGLTQLLPNQLSLSVTLSAVLGSFTGSSSGAVGIILNSVQKVGPEAYGVSPELLHRLLVCSSGMLVNLPQSGSFITFANLSGLSIKNARLAGYLRHYLRRPPLRSGRYAPSHHVLIFQI